MKKIALLFCLLSLTLTIDASPRGGGARGGGGARRAAPARQEVARSPSMSRAVSTPRPVRQQRSVGTTRPVRPVERPSQQFLTESRNRGMTSGQLTMREQQLRASLPQIRATNSQAALRAQERIRRDNPDMRNWFDNDFFDRHNISQLPYYPGGNWWRWTGWNGVNEWLGWGWGYPYYYYDSNDYDGYESYPELYAIPQDPGTLPASDQYVNPAAVQGDWLSLGVFAAGTDATQAAYSNMFLQFALKKGGDLSGTYYNSMTDQLLKIDGIVDQQSQKVIWCVGEDPSSPLMITGIYNLTQDVAPVLLHFSDGSEQTWVLVRLNQ